MWIQIPSGLAAGMRFLADPRWELGYLRGDHEPWVQDLLSRWLVRGATYCDVGAHVGFFSLCAARIVGSAGKIWAFEPDPENFRRHQSNVQVNGLADIVAVRQLAIWDRVTTVSFVRASERSSRVSGFVKRLPGAEKVAQGDNAGLESMVQTQALPLDVAVAEEPTVIKVDVEDAELHVLAGARRVLEARRSRWIVEIHSAQIGAAVRDMFEHAGYLADAFQPQHPNYPDYRQRYIAAWPR